MSERKKSCTGFGKRKLILFCHLLRLGLRYESEDCHQATHQWADDIEEAERQIYQGRDAEHTVLCVIPQAVHGTSTEVTVAESSVLQTSDIVLWMLFRRTWVMAWSILLATMHEPKHMAQRMSLMVSSQ